MERIRAVVFDLDGTLVDSLADIAAAVNSTLQSRGRPSHTFEAYRSMVGWGLRNLLVAATTANPFSENELEEAHQQVLELYHADPTARTTVYDGIPELLGSLRGVPLAVLSNKEESVAARVVETLFPGAFRAVLGARSERPPKPDPGALLKLLSDWGVAPAECAFLGDSGVDMQTARNARTLPCGALWGYRDADELNESGASALFAHPRDFAHWLSRHGEPRAVHEGVS